jgi:hypothetical protein
VGANQLALVAGKAVGTGGADLAVVVDGGIVGNLDAGGASHTTLWEIPGKFIVEDMRPVGEHG